MTLLDPIQHSSTTAPSALADLRAAWVEAAPVAAAIGIFGVIFGAVAEPVVGPWLAIASSLFIFSGAGQFTMIALLAAGETRWGVIAGIAPLALRHLPLGAMIRPHLDDNPRRRALVSWFLIDETAGLAIAAPRRTESTLLGAGSLCYIASALGTVAGIFGASAPGVADLAAATFPVLFIGLAALTAASRTGAIRAVSAAASTATLLWAWPGAGVIGAIVVAVIIAALPSPAISTPTVTSWR